MESNCCEIKNCWHYDNPGFAYITTNNLSIDKLIHFIEDHLNTYTYNLTMRNQEYLDSKILPLGT